MSGPETTPIASPVPRAAPLHSGAVTILALAARTNSAHAMLWWSTGAIVDSGEWLDLDYCWACPDPAETSTLHNDIRLGSTRGTITIRFFGRLAPALHRQALSLRGSWQILEGSGAYLPLHGSGDATVDIRLERAPTIARFVGRLHAE